MLIMPGKSYQGTLPPLTPEESLLRDRLHRHVAVLAGEIGARNIADYGNLRQAAQYVATQLKETGLPVRELPYRVGTTIVVNIEAELKGQSRGDEIVVIGAHYDTVPGCPGANDNGSGIAALLELARLLHAAQPARTVRLVAFANEEPPYFQTETMGSLVYARALQQRGEKVVAMLSLETIGCYSDAPKSQQYPAPLNLFYPDTGNFIGFVSHLGSVSLLREVIGTFRRTTRFPSEGAATPERIPGVSWSDHWAFWQAGYPAVMVTDTAPFRYPDYHEPTDTPEKLDYDRMARVVMGIERVVEKLAGK
ncbi:M28 family peptidase [Geomesophilobacter sediminis]|uniref:M20/M25/M40 family metallo-hydrolase n=1 Tax=Geomesophilobacter sediminis TaxID=2798584 RepID=A0A8J7JDI3_9BACT|nr:M28 family peptidase [Geomesophilobacter sediminis]MBJ6725198.1 M20/M25/M40 family metallo-hydrolase [Geomesophilobacter sediminis]